jgi:cobalamin biosynthesis protein CobW
VLAGTFAAYPDQVDAQRKLDPNLDHESPLHELFADQLASADLVILNKADLLDAESLAAVRAEVSEELPPAVKVVEASSGKLPLDVLLGLGAESEVHIDSRRTHHDHAEGEGHDDHDHDAFDSISIELPQAAEARLLQALNQLVVQHGILRVKGFAAIADKPMRLLIQGVGTRFDKHFDRPWSASEPRVTRLVLIGQDLDAGLLESQLRDLLAA